MKQSEEQWEHISRTRLFRGPLEILEDIMQLKPPVDSNIVMNRFMVQIANSSDNNKRANTRVIVPYNAKIEGRAQSSNWDKRDQLRPSKLIENVFPI